MKIEEFYENIHGDYGDVLRRLPSAELVVDFVKKFAEDDTYASLVSAVAADNIKGSFEAAHKLKGIAGSLAFSELYRVLIDLSERLRPLKETADPDLMKRVSDGYELIMREIKKL